MGFYQRGQLWGFISGNSCGVLSEGTAPCFDQPEQLWVVVVFFIRGNSYKGAVVGFDQREQLRGFIRGNSCEGTVLGFDQKEQLWILFRGNSCEQLWIPISADL